MNGLLIRIEKIIQQRLKQILPKKTSPKRDIWLNLFTKKHTFRNRSELDELVQSRTRDLIEANNRLQMEVLKRDLAEEQMHRKSRLIDAINQILKQALAKADEQTLSDTFLKAARDLTFSPFGLIAEQRDGCWQTTAVQLPEGLLPDSAPLFSLTESDMSEIWQHLNKTGLLLTPQKETNAIIAHALSPIGAEWDAIMTVPLARTQDVKGFVLVAKANPRYTLTDQVAMEVLTQAYLETLQKTRMERANAISEQRLNLAVGSVDGGLWDYAPISGHMYYSSRCYAMLGYSPGEFPETMETWHTLAHPEELELLKNSFNDLINLDKDAFNIEIRMLARSGQWLWLQAQGRIVEYSNKGEAQRIIGTLIDVSKYKHVEVALQKANEELQKLATQDYLTQIANRRRFEERLGQEWRRAQRENGSVAVIICDIDYFKSYNDTYGHLQGDQTLSIVAQTIHGTLSRPMDLAARYGGEEFGIILPNTGLMGAQRVARKIQKAIKELGIMHKSSQISDCITLSFGIASMVPNSNLSAQNLLEASDKALYRAKSQGRNRIISAFTEIGENQYIYL